MHQFLKDDILIIVFETPVERSIEYRGIFHCDALLRDPDTPLTPLYRNYDVLVLRNIE